MLIAIPNKKDKCSYITIIDQEDEIFTTGSKNMSHGYVDTSIDLLHRLIMRCPKNMEVDHINGNRLDNRKSNLRICTPRENRFNLPKQQRNSSGFKGVFFVGKTRKLTKPWLAEIRKDGIKIHLGYFLTKEDAALEYNKASLKYHGEFSRLNVI